MEYGEKFWNAINYLKKMQVEEGYWSDDEPYLTNDLENEEDYKIKAVKGVEKITTDVLQSLANNESPIIRVPKKVTDKSGSTCIREDLVSFANPRTTDRFSQLMNVLAKCYKLIKEDSYGTLRDLYYENVTMFHRQQNCDKAVEDITRLLGVPRRFLHVTATGKGLVAGQVTIVTNDGTRIQADKAPQGVIIPDSITLVHHIETCARFVLVVEKDATFQKIIDSDFFDRFSPCIVVTGKGYPDLSSRFFVHKLWRELKIPVLALVDADPYGMHIASVYKYGALARDEPSLCVPGLALLGVLPSEIDLLALPESSLQPLSPADHGKMASLEACPALKYKKDWLNEIAALRRGGVKAEIQSLTHLSSDYLTSAYLPNKIKSGGWIL